MRRALAAAGLVLAIATPAGAAPRASLMDIERQVMCPVCGVALNVATSPQAERERDFIRGLIGRGEDTAQIKRELVTQFGRAVLAQPSTHGFDLAAHAVPIGVVALLAAGAAAMLPRWRRRAPAAAQAPAAPEGADAARLDEELARFEA